MDNSGRDKLMDLLIEEVRQTRQEVQELRKEIWALKTRFMVIAVSMGLAGGKISQLFSFLG